MRDDDKFFPAPLHASRTLNISCYFAAFVITVGWFLLYSQLRHEGFCDEAGHMGILYHFAEAKMGLPDNLTMLPGYHFVVLTLSHFHPTDTSARATTMLFALLGLIGFAGSWIQYHGQRAGPATLLLALLPIYQPFAGMAYSDVPGIAVLLWAWWAQLRGLRWAAALLLALACCVRQTNLIWGAFFLTREFALNAGWLDPSSRPHAARDYLRLIWRTLIFNSGILAVFGLAVGLILYAGRLTPGVENGNPLRPNRATLDFGALLFVTLAWPALWRPVRTLHFTLRELFRTVPLAAWTCLGASGVIATALALTFSNPHPWNQDLFFSDTHFTLLRNWPLVFASAHPWARWGLALNLLLVAALLCRGIRLQQFHREIWLTLPFGVALLASNFLVDPRYYLISAIFLLFFWRFTRREFVGLTVWFAVICVVHDPYIVQGKALW